MDYEEKEREEEFKLILKTWARYFFTDVPILILDMVLEEGGMLFKTHNEISEKANKYLEKFKKDKLEQGLQILVNCKMIEEELVFHKIKTSDGRKKKNMSKQERKKYDLEKKEIEKNKKKYIKINKNVIQFINLALIDMEKSTREKLLQYSKDSDFWECVSCKNRMTKSDIFIRYGNAKESEIRCYMCSGIFRHNKQDKEKEQQYRQFQKILEKLRHLLDNKEWKNKSIPQKYQYTDYEIIKAEKAIQETNIFGISNDQVTKFYQDFLEVQKNENDQLEDEKTFADKVNNLEKIFKKQQLAQEQYIQIDVNQHQNCQLMGKILQHRDQQNRNH